MSLINVDSIGEQTSGNGITLDNVLKLKSKTIIKVKVINSSCSLRRLEKPTLKKKI